jgi:hypothetical protein
MIFKRRRAAFRKVIGGLDSHLGCFSGLFRSWSTEDFLMRRDTNVFPVQPSKLLLDDDARSDERGIIMRDWIAVHCLQGMLSNPEVFRSIDFDEHDPSDFARRAFHFADAMIATAGGD